jgi:hypothetical protein
MNLLPPWPWPALLALAAFAPVLGAAYPLDGTAQTGIARLEGYLLAQQGKVPGPRQPPGALLPTEAVDLRLTGLPEFVLPEPDAEFAKAVKRLLGEHADRYGVAVLDLSEPGRPRYAEHRGEARFNPGSVGKLLVALALFQELADLYPDDIAARRRVLRDTQVLADGYIRVDHHNVPFWDPARRRLTHRPLAVGDRANLYTYLDWMLSASSNAATSMVMKHTLLISHFGRDYPVSEARAAAFFRDTSRAELSELFAQVMQTPVGRNGLAINRLRQGSFFTHEGKRRVPGTTSYATPRQLLRFLLLLEQGRLVDRFSSREIKRLIYLTQKRIRYASAPVLGDAAVYFKSGSLYRCTPEPDFTCGKYQGNVVNFMSSVAIVEAPAASRDLFYLVAVMSNVLRDNQAVAHQTLATRLHRLISSHHQAGRAESGSALQ